MAGKKRDLSVLTKREIDGIRWWLCLNPMAMGQRCPFAHVGGRSVHRWDCRSSGVRDKCLALFPRLAGSGSTCPCAAFGLKYVEKVARRIVKEVESGKST